MLQGPLCCFLIYLPVGNRIGERHAELDDVRAGLLELEHKLRRGGQRGVARGDVGDEGRMAGFSQFLESFVNAVHG